jgi:hypothetical protein
VTPTPLGLPRLHVNLQWSRSRRVLANDRIDGDRQRAPSRRDLRDRPPARQATLPERVSDSSARGGFGGYEKRRSGDRLVRTGFPSGSSTLGHREMRPVTDRPWPRVSLLRLPGKLLLVQGQCASASCRGPHDSGLRAGALLEDSYDATAFQCGALAPGGSMRVIHFVRPDATAGVEPLCGVWGSMDTDWTDVAGGVTCSACRNALRDVGSGARPVGDASRDRRPV